MPGSPGPAAPEVDHSGFTGPGFDMLVRSFEPHLPAAHPDASPPPAKPAASAAPPAPVWPATPPPPSHPRPSAQQTTAPPRSTGNTGPTPRTVPETAQPPVPAPAPPARGGRGVVIGAALALVLVAVAAGVGVLLTQGDGGGKPTPSPTSPAASSPSGNATPAVPARVMRAATPRDVRAIGKGQLATLRWKLTRGNDYPIMVQQADETGSQTPQALPKRTLSTTISGLDPTKGYCFTVGAIVALGQSNGQAATIAWSKPACIRGATAH
jgi:hypothetical protein